MKYTNGSSHYLKDGYSIRPFDDYVKQRLEDLTAPIKAPLYAMEWEQARLDTLAKHIKKDPYQWFEACSNTVSNYVDILKAQSITRKSDPLLYDCVQDACTALGVEKPSAFSYSHEGNMRYNAMAVGFMDMMWIFISRHFRENNILSDAELCFILGHELGHAISCHTSVRLTQQISDEENRKQEFTSDRAGFLAALWRISKTYPSLTSDEMVQKTLECCQSVQQKLDLLPVLQKKKQPITPESFELMKKKHPITEKHSSDEDTHPTTWERCEAMKQFAVSVLLLRCVAGLWGKDHPIVSGFSGLGMLDEHLDGNILK